MRRLAPRSLRGVLAGAIAGARPATLLARVQALWPEVAGAALAAATAPVAEREGVVTIACESSLWAHELDLLQRDLLDAPERSARRPPAGAPWSGLRFKVGSLPNRSLRRRRGRARRERRASGGPFCARFAGIL